MRTRRYCPKCGKELRRETHRELRKEYPFVCYECDENFYRIETLKKKRKTSPLQILLWGRKTKDDNEKERKSTDKSHE